MKIDEMKLSVHEGAEEIFVPFNCSLSEENAEILAHIGWIRIQDDNTALIEYAIRSLIEDKIKGIEVELDTTLIDVDIENIEGGTDGPENND